MLRRIFTTLGLPPGAGILFSRQTRARLFLSLLGSVLTAMLDVVGVAALVPLMELVTNQPTDSGALGLISRFLGNDPSRSTLAITVAVGMVTAFTLKGLLAIAFRWWLIGFLNGQQRETGVRLLRGFLAAPYAMHLRRGLPDLMRSLDAGVAATYGQTVIGSVSLAAEAITILALSMILIVTNPVVALATISYFGVSALLLNRLLRRHTINAGNRALGASIGVFRTATTAIGGAKEIALRHNGEVFATEYDSARLVLARTNRLQVFLGELPRYLLETVFVLGMATMAVVVFTTDQGAAALTTLGVFLAAGTRMLPSLVRLMASLSGGRIGLPYMRLIVRELHDYPAPARLPGPPKDSGARGDVAMRGVSFRYPGTDIDVLTEISFTIRQGGSLAVVGPSGSGKTTLVDLLMGLHEPGRGAVTVDGIDVRENLAGWQSTIGMVPQDAYWMDDTIIANVAFGVPAIDVDMDRVKSSISRAQLDDVVGGLPDGLDTSIGEHGVRLSGGQRQRLGIARALYVDPQLIILDEATSALDSLTESRISETLERLHGGTTLVIVAHRLSTVRNCDQLIFLRDGRIVSRGTFDEVAATNAEFARLVELGSLTSLERHPVR